MFTVVVSFCAIWFHVISCHNSFISFSFIVISWSSYLILFHFMVFLFHRESLLSLHWVKQNCKMQYRSERAGPRIAPRVGERRQPFAKKCHQRLPWIKWQPNCRGCQNIFASPRSLGLCLLPSPWSPARHPWIGSSHMPTLAGSKRKTMPFGRLANSGTKFCSINLFESECFGWTSKGTQKAPILTSLTWRQSFTTLPQLDDRYQTIRKTYR